jgi:hypothetical protein
MKRRVRGDVRRGIIVMVRACALFPHWTSSFTATTWYATELTLILSPLPLAKLDHDTTLWGFYNAFLHSDTGIVEISH